MPFFKSVISTISRAASRLAVALGKAAISLAVIGGGAGIAIAGSSNATKAVDLGYQLSPALRSMSGSLVFSECDYTPCFCGCSGSIIMPAESVQTTLEITSLRQPELVELDYALAVPQHLLLVSIPKLQLAIFERNGTRPLLGGALPSNAIPYEQISDLNPFLFLVPLRSGAIPSNAIPSNAIPSNLRLATAIPSNAIPSNAIPSNLWGLIHAIPSNLTRQDLLGLGARADKIPGAIPSNLTRKQLIAYGIPSNAIPSNAIPSNAIPSNAIPSNAIPSNLRLEDLAIVDPRLRMIELEPRVLFAVYDSSIPRPFLPPLELQSGQGSLVAKVGKTQIKAMRNTESVSGTTSRAYLQSVPPSSEVGQYFDRSYGSLESSGSRVLNILEIQGSSWAQQGAAIGAEMLALPYGWGIEQVAVPEGEEISVEFGPHVGVEQVEIPPAATEPVACTEDLSNAGTWMSYLSKNTLALVFVQPAGVLYQSPGYEMTLANQLDFACALDTTDASRLVCTGPPWAERVMADVLVKQKPNGCVVFDKRLRTPCPYGETYHSRTAYWDGGCCTTSCWCTLAGDSEAGCWNSCPGCPP